MPKSKSRTLTTIRIVTAIESTGMEMGRDWYGFHYGIASYKGWLRFDMGHCGSIDQGSSLHSSEDYLHRSMTGRTIHIQDCVFAWGAQEDCVRQRYSIHISILAETT